MISQLAIGAVLGIVGVPAHHDDDPGDDFTALILILEEAKPVICNIVDEYRGDMTDAQVVEAGTEAFEETFNPSDEVVVHMEVILTECAYSVVEPGCEMTLYGKVCDS